MNICSACIYGIMVKNKYGKIFTPGTCDLFRDDMCPDLFSVKIDGHFVVAYREKNGDKLKPGDLYIAKRNTGWQIGKCLKVNLEDGYVMSDPPCEVYSYDLHECYKVYSIKEEDE